MGRLSESALLSVSCERKGGTAEESAHLGYLPVGDCLHGHAPDISEMVVQPVEVLLRHSDSLTELATGSALKTAQL